MKLEDSMAMQSDWYETRNGLSQRRLGIKRTRGRTLVLASRLYVRRCQYWGFERYVMTKEVF